MALDKMQRRLEAKLEIVARALGVDTNAAEWTEAGSFNPAPAKQPDAPKTPAKSKK